MIASTDALRALEPRQVAAWLRANGWTLVDSLPERAATWRLPAGDEGDFLVDLPLDPGFRDYARRIGEIVETLAVATGRPPAWVIDALRAATVDVIRFRATGPGVGRGDVALELGARLAGLTREIVLAAACAASEPRAVYRTRKPADAITFLRRVRLTAPTEGSFILTVHAPIPPELQLPLVADLSDVPFERRATLTLATSTTAARQAAERAGLDADAAPFLDGAARGISANLCDALAGFVEDDEIDRLDMLFAWASSRSVPEGTPNSAHIGADLAPMLRAGADALRVTAVTPDFELTGAVVRLDSAAPDAGGTAVIAGSVDGRPRKVRVPLAAAPYALAIRAHERGHFLRCEGALRRDGRQFQLDRADAVSIVADDE